MFARLSRHFDRLNFKDRAAMLHRDSAWQHSHAVNEVAPRCISAADATGLLHTQERGIPQPGDVMATKKKPATKAKTASKKPAAKAPAKKAVAKGAELKPIKMAFTKASLVAHLAEQSGVEAKSVKAVMAALEAATLASVNKKGIGEFTLPGLLKVIAQKVPAKPKRFGKNPFTGEEQWFAAKPATVKVKVRPLKKLKDAAL
jgi:nucleoid DNA-binding protein